jgi:hypothetical protein
MSTPFWKLTEFWVAVVSAIVIALAAWKPELKATLEALAPLIVTIIVAVLGGVALKAWTEVTAIKNGYVRKNGAYLPK